jgi:hypothetical protein
MTEDPIVSTVVTSTPIFTSTWARLLVIALGYALTLSLSGRIVRMFVQPAASSGEANRSEATGAEQRWDSSVVIGKCENIITITFVLADQITGLALIFAGKSWARSEAIKSDPGYYLGGTLVNLVWAMLVGFLLRLVVFGEL